MNILLIDDEEVITDYFTQLANVRGIKDIDTAGSGEQALTCVMRKNYDLITLDIKMPGVSGLEIIAMLRNMCPHAIIAVISGYIPDEVDTEVANCVDVMIDKPVNIETFNQLLSCTEQICQTMTTIRSLGLVPESTR